MVRHLVDVDDDSRLPWWNIVPVPRESDVALTLVKNKIHDESEFAHDPTGGTLAAATTNARRHDVARRVAWISHSKGGVLNFGGWPVTPTSPGLANLGVLLSKRNVVALYLLGCSTGDSEIGYQLPQIQHELNRDVARGKAIRLYGTRTPIGSDMFNERGLIPDEVERNVVVQAHLSGSPRTNRGLAVNMWLARHECVERTRIEPALLNGAQMVTPMGECLQYEIDNIATPRNAIGFGNVCESVAVLAPRLLLIPDAQLCCRATWGKRKVLVDVYYDWRLLSVPTRRQGKCLYYLVREEARKALKALFCEWL